MRGGKSEKISDGELVDLVGRAADGDQLAWERLVDQYSRLIRSVARNYRLSESDAADVTQTTWMRLLEHINRIDPVRIGAWLTVTTHRECLRVIALRKRVSLMHDDSAFDETPARQPEPDAGLLADERASEVRKAMQTLPVRWQQMLSMLMKDPPSSYAEISEKLGIPIGSIGPVRGRCLARLREQLTPLRP